MDRATRNIYERSAREWIGARRPEAVRDGRLDRFAAKLLGGGRVADLGCGPGWYARALCERSFRSVGLDLSGAMLKEARRRNPQLPWVRGDLARLPFARESLQGAFAINCYCHVPLSEFPVALAHLHASLAVGAAVELTLARLERFELSEREAPNGEAERRGTAEFLPGRLFSVFSAERAAALLEGAGFEVQEIEPVEFWLRVRARRMRTLPDFVRPGVRLLVCGINPSLYAADCGVPFGRPGNRFWPAAERVGLATGLRDPFQALEGGLGFSDFVKRATAEASELGRAEYRRGRACLESLVRIYRPGAICFVGLAGYRHAVDPHAKPGRLPKGFGGRPAYLMPSTSGRNAHARLDDLIAHLRSALEHGSPA